MRNAFIEELVQAAYINEKIALVVGDLGYGVVEPFAKKFPKRFFNAGVAEQNMMGLSAGLASEGFHVFVYSIANFPTLRCAEQVRNDVDYHNLSVTIVAVGGGLAYGNLGYSHHAIQDYALMRCMPNMLIAAPGDSMEVRACMKYLLSNPQPSYLRLGKSGEANIHNHVPKVSPGKWLPISISRAPDRHSAILSTGSALNLANETLNKYSLYKKGWSLYSLPLWGMRSKNSQIRQVEFFKKIVTVENHLIDGGFGSWLLESVVTKSELLARINVKTLNEAICGLVGSEHSLSELSGMTPENLLDMMNSK